MNKLVLYSAVLLLACTKSSIKSATSSGQQGVSNKATVSLATEYQTIHSFGASDCWSAKFVGTWADDARKNQIADLLFSLDTLPTGQPKGIGLSLWRMNIGAGSTEQGESSNIGDEWRREECFLKSDGQYDWSKQAGSQWFLTAARRRGVPYTLGFTNSPPVQMTVNGKAFSPGGTAMNLKPERVADFADFLTQVSDHFGFTYVSPFNEPQWDWKAGNNGKAGQEGTPARNEDIVSVVKVLSDKLVASRSKTTVVTGEAGQLDYLYEKAESGKGNQVEQLFGSAGSSLASLPKVERIMAYHSYFSTCDDTKLVKMRQSAQQAARSVNGLSLWQSEFGVLGDICGKLNGYPRSTGIDYGLYVAKVIHNDLTVANATSWQWWLAINPYNYSDGLVYINGPDGAYKDHRNARESGQVVNSRQLWAFGNFARFVRPGMKRIDVTLETNADPVAQAGNLMLSGYKEERTKTVVLIAINTTDQPMAMPLSGLSVTKNQFATYTTSQDKNLAKATVLASRVQLEPKSVTTLVGHYN
jgi:O-glycosyl hydrolase